MADGLVRVGALSKAGAAGATPPYTQDTFGNLVNTPFIYDLLRRGHVYVSGDADENDRVTGQTSYAATTPTFLLRVPTGATAMPLWVNASQAGTVAGGPISVYFSFDRVDRFSTGGTSEAITHMRTDQPQGTACTVLSGATAAAATDARVIYSQLLDEDVTDPNLTESIHALAFRDFVPPILVGPAAFMVFTYAATTGPTWEWSLGFAAWGSTASSQS